jgi:uncharacterized protein (DUF111 family)
LTTPTGAAILAALAPDYTEQPALTLERVGHGIGSRDYPGWPNVLRLLIGTADSPNDPEVDRVVQLETNLDDVPAEVIGYCIEQLWSAGALDVYIVPIQMKKGRPGVMLGVLAGIEEADACARLLFRETGTFGIRRQTIERWKLQRRMIEVQTPWGPVRAKQGWRDGIRIVSPEYEDCARIARDHGIPLRDVYAFVQSRADQPEA